MHATGGEFDGEVRPLEWLMIRGSLTLTDSTFVNSAEPPLEGKQLPQLPRAAGSIWGHVQLPWQLDATVVWRSIGAQFDDDRNQFELQPADQVDARNHGHHDKWLVAKRSGHREYGDMPLTLGYYTRADIPFYYALADAFTICDQYFCSSLTGTTANRCYLWTGTIRERPTAAVPGGSPRFAPDPIVSV